MIKKPWGSEEIPFTSDKYTVKRLTMTAGHCCSLQYHEHKFEDLEPACFYVSNWNEFAKNRNQKSKKGNCSFPGGEKYRYLDLWFIGNMDHMRTLASTYDKIPTLGNKEYDQHDLTFAVMYKSHPNNIRFIYYKGIDYELYRTRVIGVHC